MRKEVFRWDSKLGRGVWVYEKPGEAELNQLRETPARLLKIWLDYNTARVEIHTKTRYVDAFSIDAMERARKRRDEEMGANTARVLERLKAEREEVLSLEKIVRRGIREQLGRGEISDTNAALLQETREQRAWERLKPQLDRISPDSLHVEVRKLTQEALAEGNEHSIAALRSEIEAYAKGRGGDPVSCMHYLNQEHARSSPDVAAALNDLAEVEAGCSQLVAAINMLQYAIQRGELFATVPAWKKGEVATFKLDPVDISDRR